MHKEEIKDEISLVRGSFYGSSGIISRIIFLFIVNILLARKLGPTNYGIWTLNFLILSFSNIISFLGLNRGVSRIIGYYRGQRKLGEINTIIGTSLTLGIGTAIFLSMILFLCSSSIANLFRISILSWMLKIGAISLLPITFLEITGAVFQGFENIKLARIVNSFLPSLLWLVGVLFLMVSTNITLKKLTVVYLSCFLSAGIIGWIICIYSKTFIFKTARFSISMINPLLQFCLPLFFFDILTLIRVSANTLLVGYFLTPHHVGIYNVALRIARLTGFILLGNMDIFTPLISKNLASNNLVNPRIKELYLRSAKWIFVFTSLMIVTLMLFPNLFLSFFGKYYVEGSAVLRLLLVGYLLYIIFGPTEAMNIALGNTKFVAAYTFIGSASTIFLSLYLIPYMEINGAAISMVISILLMKTIAFCKLQYHDKISLLKSKYFKLVIVSLLSGGTCGLLIVNLLGNIFSAVFIFLICFSVIHFFILKMLNMIDKKDIIIFNLILNKFRMAKIWN